MITEYEKNVSRALFEIEAGKRATDVERSHVDQDRYKYEYANFMWDFWQQAQSACRITEKAKEVHPDDIAVDRFSDAMKNKMAEARARGRSGWDDPTQCSADVLQDMLVEHLAKGDPVDIGNFAMMLWNRGEVTASADSIYRRKLGEFADEAFRESQRANKLAAEWGLAQIMIVELRNENNRLRAEAQYKWNEGDDEHS